MLESAAFITGILIGFLIGRIKVIPKKNVYWTRHEEDTNEEK